MVLIISMVVVIILLLVLKDFVRNMRLTGKNTMLVIVAIPQLQD
jgi:hypothetical protein